MNDYAINYVAVVGFALLDWCVPSVAGVFSSENFFFPLALCSSLLDTPGLLRVLWHDTLKFYDSNF
jgi:hypothetical protein